MKTLFKVITGSHSYGLNIETSDTDFKSVFQCDNNDILALKYKEQENYSKDYIGYEVRRFLELLRSANPTVLELLFTNEKFILEKDPIFDLVLQNKEKFLTKKCRESFGGYAHQQIKKALGLQKKFRWEGEKIEKKDPFDFCYVIEDGKTYPLKNYLEGFGGRLKEKQIGLVNLDHAPHCYSIYLRWEGEYNGIFEPNSDRVITSSVAISEKDVGTLVYNRDSYKIHCKDWASYQEWLNNRNEARYVENLDTGLKADHKNLMHCRRLLNMAMEIPKDKTLNVFRNDREKLLAIRRGESNLEELLKEAEEDLHKLDDLYANCDLPDSVDFDFLNDLLLKIRKAY